MQNFGDVVMYHKGNKFWKQFTTGSNFLTTERMLWCITKVINSESNSQQSRKAGGLSRCCDVSQR